MAIALLVKFTIFLVYLRENSHHRWLLHSSDPLVHYLETRGLLDRVRVEQATGLTLATLKDPDLRVPASAHYRLWELAEQLTAWPKDI